MLVKLLVKGVAISKYLKYELFEHQASWIHFMVCILSRFVNLLPIFIKVLMMVHYLLLEQKKTMMVFDNVCDGLRDGRELHVRNEKGIDAGASVGKVECGAEGVGTSQFKLLYLSSFRLLLYILFLSLFIIDHHYR